jgi:hypothetical protein
MKSIRLLPILSACAIVVFTGCGKKHDSHAPAAGHGQAHAHTAPHGGVLVELGAHQYNLEFVRDSAAGRLTVYALDGHAENFVRLAQPEIVIAIRRGDLGAEVALKAVANPATGEMAGDTSQFEAVAEVFTGTIPFDAVVKSVTLRGTKFDNVRVTVPGPADVRAADHEKHPRTNR